MDDAPQPETDPANSPELERAVAHCRAMATSLRAFIPLERPATRKLHKADAQAIEAVLSALSARQPEGGEVVKAFWLILHEPGCVPDLKGPWPRAVAKAVMREFMAARPTAYIDVLELDGDEPSVQHGPELLQMLDGRSMSVGRRHNAQTREAHAEQHAAVAAERARALAAEARVAELETLAQVRLRSQEAAVDRHARTLEALEAAEAKLERALVAITWQDVRLAAGEGVLKPGDVLAACNAELRRRSTLSTIRGEGESNSSSVAESAARIASDHAASETPCQSEGSER